MVFKKQRFTNLRTLMKNKTPTITACCTRLWLWSHILFRILLAADLLALLADLLATVSG